MQKPTTTQTTFGYSQNAENSEITDVINSFLETVRAGNIDDIMAFYSDDVLVYDMMPPLEIKGKEKHRANFERCFTDYFQFPITYDYESQQIETAKDFAVMNGLIHFAGTSKKGEKMDNWMRTTICFKKIDGTWLITNEHVSIPMNEETGEGMMDLKPDSH